MLYIYIYLMSTKSYVFKPDDNTLLPPIFDPKITISTVPILQTCAVAIKVVRNCLGKRDRGFLH